MPKINNTRKQRAKQLLENVIRGPQMGFNLQAQGLTSEQAEYVRKMYKIWSTSWVIPEIISLIPELKHEKEG